MLGYRLYYLGADGHFSGSVEFEAEHDRAAMMRAESKRRGQAAELWERSRQVWVFDGYPVASGSPFAYSEDEPEGL